MKDVFSVKRSADSDDVLKHVNGQFRKVEVLTADRTLEDVESGTILAFNSTSAIAVTLPSSASAGVFYDFVVLQATNDAAGHSITVGDTTDTTGDFLFGSLTLLDDQVSSPSNGCNGRGIMPAIHADTGDNKILMDANATNGGGEAGTYIRLTCLGDKITSANGPFGHWLVQGQVMCPTTSTGADLLQHV